jgi:plasmid stabilization system protein ParE
LAEVVWTDAAIGDLERIADYIEAFSSLAAQRMAVRLIAAASSLELAPERGRSIGDGRRELVVITPYVSATGSRAGACWCSKSGTPHARGEDP